MFGQIAISSILVRSNNDSNNVIKQVDFSLRTLLKTYGFASYAREIFRGNAYGEMIFNSQMRKRLYCRKTF